VRTALRYLDAPASGPRWMASAARTPDSRAPSIQACRNEQCSPRNEWVSAAGAAAHLLLAQVAATVAAIPDNPASLEHNTS
jgi:hypothetical protein